MVPNTFLVNIHEKLIELVGGESRISFVGKKIW